MMGQIAVTSHNDIALSQIAQVKESICPRSRCGYTEYLTSKTSVRVNSSSCANTECIHNSPGTVLAIIFRIHNPICVVIYHFSFVIRHLSFVICG
ncbi:MAG: hypothetical protein CLLPBCKN_007922 [Chroococcidiopsis cubana SAG 39.79]|uniref:hypothetical protein n=1 Tax=Chroococcidiopsis cubana TaxID=171392 RepID=UPI000F8D3AD2|nr:hypothetical protein [Chroococcidiopsis cubana]MDZ4878487.1 hypothetical protein [Chroococcidiopsis cubana SAG 39.79]